MATTDAQVLHAFLEQAFVELQIPPACLALASEYQCRKAAAASLLRIVRPVND
ncbi:MAG: hypothetical protein U0892_05625 [Pirellulales bacterium]